MIGHLSAFLEEYFYLVFPVVWLAVTGMVSVVGGWTTLAKTYRAEKRETGELSIPVRIDGEGLEVDEPWRLFVRHLERHRYSSFYPVPLWISGSAAVPAVERR